MDVTVAQEPVAEEPKDKPPRWPVALVVLAILAILPLWGRETAGEGPTSDTPEVTTTTSTPPAVAEGERLLGSTALRRGPGLTWEEWTLPDEVSAMHAIGEFAGQLWVVASTQEADLRGIHTGATVYSGDPTAWDVRWGLDTDQVVIDADISSAGIVVLSTTTGSARVPYAAADLAAHSTADGDVWTTTQLDMGERSVTNLGVVAGSTETGAWVHGISAGDTPRAVTDALPDAIAGLVDSNAADAFGEGANLVVTGPLGFPVFTAPLLDLGLSPDLRIPSTRNTSMLWRAEGFGEFEPAAGPLDELIIDLAAGTDGRLVATTADRRVSISSDGRSWRAVPEAAGGSGQPAAQSVSDLPLSIYHDRIQILSDDEIADIVLDVPTGTGFSPNVDPAAGPAGLAVLTASDGPDPTISISDAEVVTAEARFQLARRDRTITVIQQDGTRATFDPSSTEVSFDATTSELVMADTWRIPLAALERAYLASVRLDSGGPFGVAFSQNGQVWGWSPIVDEDGYSLGPISILSVGESSVYAVADLPQIRTAPRAETPLAPRLIVGSFG
jgi:hypothetical protein